MNVYVAVWRSGTFITGRLKGRRTFRFIAMGRTKTEARRLAYVHQALSTNATRRIKRYRRDPIRIMRCDAAILLEGVTQRQLMHHFDRLLGVAFDANEQCGCDAHKRARAGKWVLE